jgi:hypothetical protein
LAAAGENCAVVTAEASGYRVSLLNAIGAPVESKALPAGLVPALIAMTPYHVLVADGRCIYVWQYRTQVTARRKPSTSPISRPQGPLRSLLFFFVSPPFQCFKAPRFLIDPINEAMTFLNFPYDLCRFSESTGFEVDGGGPSLRAVWSSQGIGP